MKDVAPEDGSRYDAPQRRIADIRKSGRAHTRSSLLKYITDGPDGPDFPAGFPRVSRGKLAQVVFIRDRQRKLIAAS